MLSPKKPLELLLTASDLLAFKRLLYWRIVYGLLYYWITHRLLEESKWITHRLNKASLFSTQRRRKSLCIDDVQFCT